MKKLILAISLSGLMMACNTAPKDSKEVAEDQNEKKMETSKSEDAAEFAVKAADGGMMEVKLGELSKANASAQVVKDFGSMMIADHGKGGEELKALAQQKNITLPTSLSHEKQEHYNDLAKKKGADFDKAYIDFMVKDHKEDIEEFKEEADKNHDAELKNWAAGKIPTLEHHLAEAQKIQGSLK